jgi:hypothetical protein
MTVSEFPDKIAKHKRREKRRVRMGTHEELVEKDRGATEKILKDPGHYRKENGKLDYLVIMDEFQLSVNRTYLVIRHVEAELAKKTQTHKKS